MSFDLLKRVSFILFVFFCVGVLVSGQDKQIDKDKQLREQILSVYKTCGEKGLLDFFKKNRDKITNEFIVAFAEAGVKERKEEWLKACEIMARESKDEKTLADVLSQAGEYLRLIGDLKMAIEYCDKALLIYGNLNELIVQDKVNMGKGNIYLRKGIIYGYNYRNISAALELYDKALPYFEKSKDLRGQGRVYLRKGDIYFYTGDNSKSLEMYEKALVFFKKSRNLRAQGALYLRKGEVYFVAGNNQKSLEMYNAAQTFLKKTGNLFGHGNFYLQKGNVYQRLNKKLKALEMYNKALLFFEKAGSPNGIGAVYLEKGQIYFYSGENCKAFEMYNKASPFFKKTGNSIRQGDLFLRKGEYYLRIGDTSKAIEMFDKAMVLYERGRALLGQGNVCLWKSVIYCYTGENYKAIEMLGKALPFFEKAGEPLGQGNVYLKRGDIYHNIGYSSKALAMYDTSLFFYEKVENALVLGHLYLKKGIVYSYTGKNEKALGMFDKALQLFEKAGNPLGIGNVYLEKGNILLSINMNMKAVEMYEKALSNFEKVESLASQGVVFQNKGLFYFRICDYNKAFDMFNKALSFFEKTGEVNFGFYTFFYIAKIMVKQREIEKAQVFFEKVIANLERMRKQTGFSEMKRSFLEKVYEKYEETVLFMLENGYHKKGFKYAESMRSRVFLDKMGEGLAHLGKGLKLELKEQRDRLVGKLSALSKQMHETASKDEKKLAELKEQYQKTQYEFEDLLIKIRLNNPLYADVRYPQPITVPELQKETLKENEILVRYFIAPEKLYVFLVSEKNFKVIPLDIKEKEIEALVTQYLTALKENSSRRIKRYGKKLYEKTFQPLEKQIKTFSHRGHREHREKEDLKAQQDIIIIPDGDLAKIPFEALIVDNKTPGRPTFLIEKYRLKYIQSASILSVLRKHYQRNSKTNTFVGFGDPVYDYEKFAQAEMKALSGKKTKLNKSFLGVQGAIFQKSPLGAECKKEAAGSEEAGIEEEIREIHQTRFARAGGKLPRLKKSGEEVKAIAEL